MRNDGVPVRSLYVDNILLQGQILLLFLRELDLFLFLYYNLNDG